MPNACGEPVPVPEAVTAADWSTEVTVEEMADGVYRLGGGPANSYMVEFSDFVAVFEAPGDEERSLAVIDEITRLAPDKPIRWVITSHPHFDHIGGLRTYLHVGSTIVTHLINLDFLNHDVLSYEPRTIEPDIVSKWPPTELAEGYNYEAIQENYVITDDTRILRVYYVQPLGHVTGMLMAWLPAERIAFQADLFDTHEPPKAAQLPAMRSLRTQAQRMNLDVETWPGARGTGALERVPGRAREPRAVAVRGRSCAASGRGRTRPKNLSHSGRNRRIRPIRAVSAPPPTSQFWRAAEFATGLGEEGVGRVTPAARAGGPRASSPAAGADGGVGPSPARRRSPVAIRT